MREDKTRNGVGICACIKTKPCAKTNHELKQNCKLKSTKQWDALTRQGMAMRHSLNFKNPVQSVIWGRCDTTGDVNGSIARSPHPSAPAGPRGLREQSLTLNSEVRIGFSMSELQVYASGLWEVYMAHQIEIFSVARFTTLIFIWYHRSCRAISSRKLFYPRWKRRPQVPEHIYLDQHTKTPKYSQSFPQAVSNPQTQVSIGSAACWDWAMMIYFSRIWKRLRTLKLQNGVSMF